MAKLHFKYSSMNSGKTALMIQTAHNYKSKNMFPVIIKPSMDTRDTTDAKVVSRTGLEWEAILLDVTDEAAHDRCITGCIKSGANVIMVDEVQFFPESFVRKLAKVVDTYDIPVLCYGLRNSFNSMDENDKHGGGFPSTDFLLRHADKLEEVKTICYCGSKATHNMLVIEGKVIKRMESSVLVGGDDIYHSVCRNCFRIGRHS